MINALGTDPIKEESLDFIGGVERVTLLLVEAVRIAFQDAPDVSGIRRAILVDDVTEDENLARTKNVRRGPIKRGPIHGQTEITFTLRSEPANRGAVEGEIVPALDEELFVVIEHMEAAFEVAE